MKKAVMARKPNYYTSFEEGDVLTLLEEMGYSMAYGANRFLLKRDSDGLRQVINEGDFQWLGEKDIVEGDIVRITDVSRVICAHFYFKNGDTTEVVEENEEGGMYVKVPENADSVDTQYRHGEPVLYITKEERKYFEKVTQDTQDTETHEQDTKDCRIAELEAEVAELKEQLAAAKTLLKGAL